MNKENEPRKRSNNETPLSQRRPLEPIDMNARKTQDGGFGIQNQCYNSRARARKERMENIIHGLELEKSVWKNEKRSIRNYRVSNLG